MRDVGLQTGRLGAAVALWLGAVAVVAVPQAAFGQSVSPGTTGSEKAHTAAPSNIAITANDRTRRLTLPIGKSTIVDLPSDASEVFVGNPQVANAVVRSARRLYVMAVGNGQTTIFALDKTGQQIASLDLVVVKRDLTELKNILNTALPGNDINVQGIEDTVILTGSVASAVDAQKAQDIASGYVGYSTAGGGSSSTSGGGTSVNFSGSTVVNGSLINALTIRGQEQVMLKVQVVEVQRDIVKQLGVSVNGSWNGAGITGNGTSSQTPSLSSIGGTASNLALDYTGAKSSLTSSIQAFERNGVARVLAEPNVTAISGETAKFTVGGTIPISTGSTLDPTTGRCTVTTTLQDYGVTLNFTPTVLSEGRISLHLATEVTEPDGTTSAQFACSNSIGFRTRKNSTTVELPSGGSIVSAGLIEQSSKQAIAGTPGLMNLPILGALFRSRDYQRSESELMIIVTPYLVKSLRPDQISKPDDGFADATDPASWLLGRMNRIYSTANNPELIKNYRGKVGFIAD